MLVAFGATSSIMQGFFFSPEVKLGVGLSRGCIALIYLYLLFALNRHEAL